ncbi:HNH endonuclease [Shewanella algae]|uniref:HNH endonuclease n=1 Tax=Shewanella algae TaxID=38313 RepID=UPI0031F4DC71
MQLYFHDVGLDGANRDFPKTVFGDVSISDIISHMPQDIQVEAERALCQEFPSGFCNVWGVPAGAKSVIHNLSHGDAMLLIKTTGGGGEIPALCIVKGFWRSQMPELSKFLWNSTRFPFVFFFKTINIDLSWVQFKQDVQYLPKYRPSGKVSRVKTERLAQFGGAKGYVSHLTQNDYSSNTLPTPAVKETSPENEYLEGIRKLKEIEFFNRNVDLVKAAKQHYGYVCQACGFDFEKTYGILGINFIECHHKTPLSESDTEVKTKLEDVCVLCSNCHRMVHRTTPALEVETLRKILLSLRLQTTD